MNTEIQEDAANSLKKEVKMPAWAIATIGILNDLVTLVLALGVDVGVIVDKNIDSSNLIQLKQVDYEGKANEQAIIALTKVLEKLADKDKTYSLSEKIKEQDKLIHDLQDRLNSRRKN